MAIQKWLLFLFLHIHVVNIVAQLPNLRYSLCGDNGNYTENSTYKNNLNTLLNSLPSKIDKYGFYNASIGQNSDRASVIVLCRGDVELDECRDCVSNVAQQLVQLCPNQKEAFGGYDGCMLQYSNRSIIGTASFSVQLFLWNPANASKPEEFNQELSKLFENLRDRAARGGSLQKYASGNATGPDFQPIYALVQCTPDLSRPDCFNCLTDAYGTMPSCPCRGKRGGRIIGVRCNLLEKILYNIDIGLKLKVVNNLYKHCVVASHCLESDFGPTPVQIVVAGRSPRFHSHSQTRALVAESLEVAQNQLPKKYSKKKKRGRCFLFSWL